MAAPMAAAIGRDRGSDISIGNDSQPGYLGALLGLGFAATSNASLATTLGLTFGTRFNRIFGLGFYGSYYGQNASGPYLGLPTGTDTSAFVAMGQGILYMENFHVGAELGAGVRTWQGVASSLSNGTSTITPLFGLTGGYDFRLSRNLSIGLEGHYLIPLKNTEVDLIQLFANVKLWL